MYYKQSYSRARHGLFFPFLRQRRRWRRPSPPSAVTASSADPAAPSAAG